MKDRRKQIDTWTLTENVKKKKHEKKNSEATAEVRQVHTNTEMVYRQHTVVELHVECL